MQKKQLPTVLILGCEGLVGKTVFEYLHSIHKDSTFGTTRSLESIKKNVLYFDAYSYESSFKKIYMLTKKIDFVINCIGVLKNYERIDDLIYINSLFPQNLLKLSQKYKFKIIHISTNAVFSNTSGTVDENSEPSPNDKYSASKYLGELGGQDTITIRSSFLGFDPKHTRGLLEFINNTDKTITGFTNQLWSGCTSLQFAKLCEDIVFNNHFKTIKEVISIMHFAPLGPITKYNVIKKYLSIKSKKNKLIKAKGVPVTRVLKTCYLFDFMSLDRYTNNITTAINELISCKYKK